MKNLERSSAAPQWALPLAIAIVAGTGIGASFAAVATKPAPDSIPAVRPSNISPHA